MKRKLLLDISNIYSIRISIIEKLFKLAETCICDYIVEAKLKNDDLLEINIGFGKLFILVLEDSIEYKFVPSSKLEKNIIESIKTLKSPLENSLESGLEEKLLSTYKELF